MQNLDSNLFLTLGKYTERQHENLFTQALAALFNHAPKFRADFLKFLNKKRDEGVAQGLDYRAVTQCYDQVRGNRIFVDLEIHTLDGQESRPAYVVEAKLAAPFSAAQAGKYADLLHRRAGGSTLVVITKYGLDTELYRRLRGSTIWMTWTEIAALASGPAHRSVTEKLLCKEFVEMLKAKNIPMVPPVTVGNFNKLHLLNKLIVSSNQESLHADGLGAVTHIMTRMQIFAEARWSGLSKQNYKPYARIWAYRPTENEYKPYACINVGFYIWKNKSKVKDRYIALSIDCKAKTMEISGGWLLADAEDYDNTVLAKWNTKQTRNFFTTNLDEAHKKIEPAMDKALGQFRKSKYFK